MPRYRFTAVDAFGTLHDGAIDAATETDARNKLASNGLSVRTVEEAAGSSGVEPPDVPRRASPKSPAGGPAAAARGRAADTPAAPGRGMASVLPLVLSLLALFVSAGTAVYTFTRTRDEPGSRLGRYDFSSPEKAYTSSVKMVADGDVVARFERDARLYSAAAKEQLSTLVVSRTRDFNGKKVLFIQYDRKGVERRIVRAFEKDEDTGMWKRSYAVEFGRGNAMPQALQEEIGQWVTRDHGDEQFMPDFD